MEAWDFGPVSREVYEEFCRYGWDNIPCTNSYYSIDEDSLILKKEILKMNIYRMMIEI